jgi:uncharacterized protein (DUF1501 family)
VLPIAPLDSQGRSFALHPLLANLRGLFDNERRLAILPNIGPLLRPTDKAQYASATYPKPARLYSHNDQQSTWMALGPEGSTLGWGGRMGDVFASTNSRRRSLPSRRGNAVFLAGDVVRQYQVNTSGAIPFGVNASGQVFGSATVGASLQRLATSVRTAHPFDADLAATVRRSIDAEQALRMALRPASMRPSAPRRPVAPTTPPTTRCCAMTTP